MTETGTVPGPEQVADRMAITDVIYTHCRGVDRASEEILKSTYWPDAEVDYGGYKGPAHPFCESLPGAIRRYSNTQHQVSNMMIELAGNRAVVETYVTAHHYLAVEGGLDTEMTYIGRYLDDMEKRDGVWKIRFRKIVMTWHQNALATADEVSNPSLTLIARASRHPDDPLFEFLDTLERAP